MRPSRASRTSARNWSSARRTRSRAKSARSVLARTSISCAFSRARKTTILADYKYLLERGRIDREPAKQPNCGNRLLGRAYGYFQEKISPDVSDLLKLMEKINQLMFVQITVGSQADAFTLFESLNNRGVPLSAMDIIKNKMLAQMERSTQWTSTSRLNAGRDSSRQSRTRTTKSGSCGSSTTPSSIARKSRSRRYARHALTHHPYLRNAHQPRRGLAV